MHITLIPHRPTSPVALKLRKSGDVLTINGQSFDFSALIDGDVFAEVNERGHIVGGMAIHPLIFGPVQREAGHIELSLFLPVGKNHASFEPIVLSNVPDGPVQLPTQGAN